MAAATLVSSVVAAQVCATPGRDSGVATIAGIINSYCPGGTGAVASCSANNSPIAAVCPPAAQWPNLLTPAGLLLSSFPALGSVSFDLNCSLTATGLA